MKTMKWIVKNGGKIAVHAIIGAASGMLSSAALLAVIGLAKGDGYDYSECGDYSEIEIVGAGGETIEVEEEGQTEEGQTEG